MRAVKGTDRDRTDDHPGAELKQARRYLCWTHYTSIPTSPTRRLSLALRHRFRVDYRFLWIIHSFASSEERRIYLCPTQPLLRLPNLQQGPQRIARRPQLVLPKTLNGACSVLLTPIRPARTTRLVQASHPAHGASPCMRDSAAKPEFALKRRLVTSLCQSLTGSTGSRRTILRSPSLSLCVPLSGALPSYSCITVACGRWKYRTAVLRGIGVSLYCPTSWRLRSASWGASQWFTWKFISDGK